MNETAAGRRDERVAKTNILSQKWFSALNELEITETVISEFNDQL